MVQTLEFGGKVNNDKFFWSKDLENGWTFFTFLICSVVNMLRSCYSLANEASDFSLMVLL